MATKILIFEHMDNQNLEHKEISINTFIVPCIIVFIMIFIKWLEIKFNFNFKHLAFLLRKQEVCLELFFLHLFMEM